jgi:hypothetical protein
MPPCCGTGGCDKQCGHKLLCTNPYERAKAIEELQEIEANTVSEEL